MNLLKELTNDWEKSMQLSEQIRAKEIFIAQQSVIENPDTQRIEITKGQLERYKNERNHIMKKWGLQ